MACVIISAYRATQITQGKKNETQNFPLKEQKKYGPTLPIQALNPRPSAIARGKAWQTAIMEVSKLLRTAE